MKVPFVDLARIHAPLQREFQDAFARVAERGAYILGPEVEAFEREFAAYTGTAHAVGVANGSDALVLALRALGVGPGDEVVTVSHTFVATVDAVLHVGARPVLVDVDGDTGCMDASAARRALTTRTKALLPVHLYGHPADMEPLCELADAHDLPVVEDAAQAHGASYHGRPCGSLGRVACFSFYPGKNLGALGDGGAVVSDDADLVERLRILRNYGQRKKYQHELVGRNSRLDEVQAALLRIKLRHLDAWNDSRRAAARRYAERLASASVALPSERAGARHVYHLYAVRDPRRDELLQRLTADGIGAGIHYPEPVHVMPPYRHLTPPGGLPRSEAWARETLSLPVFAGIRDEEVDAVAAAVTRHRPRARAVVGERR